MQPEQHADLTAELMLTGQLPKSCAQCGCKPICSVTGQHQAGSQPEVLTCPACVSNLMSSSPAVQSCGIQYQVFAELPVTYLYCICHLLGHDVLR